MLGIYLAYEPNKNRPLLQSKYLISRASYCFTRRQSAISFASDDIAERFFGVKAWKAGVNVERVGRTTSSCSHFFIFSLTEITVSRRRHTSELFLQTVDEVEDMHVNEVNVIDNNCQELLAPPIRKGFMSLTSQVFSQLSTNNLLCVQACVSYFLTSHDRDTS